MTDLDKVKSMKKLDKTGVLESTSALGLQIEQVWRDVKNFNLPPDEQKIKNVVVFGMGGSALGAHIIQSLYGTIISVPFLFQSGYEVPGFVGPDTLALLSSYSGTTEEVLQALEVCEERGAHLLGMSIGGPLAKKLGNRCFKILPKHNPSGHPRLGGGYMTFGLLGLLNKLGLTEVSDSEVAAAASLAKKLSQELAPEKRGNPAMKLAKKLNGFNVVIAASEHLVGNAHVFANQLNETSKNFANYFTVPELNHHLMEGLKFPKLNKRALKFVFLESELYNPRVRLRYEITKDVVGKNGVKSESIELQSKTKLLQAVQMLVMGAFISFYLAMLGKVDPGDIRWVNYFKDKLK